MTAGNDDAVPPSPVPATGELQRRETELGRLNDRLKDLDRARSEFFSKVSREFRTPLTLLLGPLEDILDSPAAAVAPDSRAVLEVAHRNALRLLSLVDTMLDFSQIEAESPRANCEPTDLATFTADLASNFRSACEWAGLSLVVDCPTLPGPVNVDRDMWEKIVVNLVANAFKFTFEGSIAVRLHAGEGSVQLTVQDSGAGIPENELPHIFDRFHHVAGASARARKSNGIGLGLVRELVQVHDGSIDVRSVLGQGSTFTVSLPLATGPQAAAAGNAAAPAAPPAAAPIAAVPRPDGAGASPPVYPPRAAVHAASPGRVVVADDNADMQAYLGHLLEAAGYEVETCADGHAALAACRARPPDAVISDVIMPGLDGFALIERLRADENTAVIPVLLLSARADEDARIAGLGSGADDYLVKPFGRRELMARVDGAVRLARLRREAARRVQADFEAMFSMAPDGVIVVGPHGNILKANGRAQHLFGYSAEEFVGLRVEELLPVKLRANHARQRDIYSRAPTVRLMSPNRVLHGCRRDGSDFSVEVGLGPLQFKDQPCTIAIVRDITERVEFENRIIESEKLEAIGHLTGGLAHDFNNLLGIILGNLDLLKPGLLRDDDRHHHDLACQAATRGAQITKSLLAVARKQTLEPRKVDVCAAISEMMPLIRQSAGSPITIEEARCADSHGGVFANVDAAGLGNAVLNLVMNARDAMPRGGALMIGIDLQSIEATDLAAPSDLAPGRHIVISVTDNGTGMSAEVAAKAFEPFFTTKERGHGTGLGLAMVYGFARQSAGTARIISQPGVGTTVQIYLPAVSGDAAAISPVAPAVPAPSAGNGERILVVDDESMLLDVTHEWLRRLGYAVAKTTSATEALEKLRHEPFDMLLTDVTMPGMTGMELADQAIALQPGIRVALVSGFAEDMLHTGWPLLEKPFSRDQLAQTVRQVLAMPGPAARIPPPAAPDPPPAGRHEPDSWYARIVDYFRGD